MKKILLYVLIVFLLVPFTVIGQTYTTLKVIGNELKDSKGNNVVLKGVNYNLLDDGNIKLTPTNQTYHNYINQVALTGANSIRIPWFTDEFPHWRKNYPNNGTPQAALVGGQLSNLLAYCHTKGLIPILELHDYTCDNNWSNFNNKIRNWWLQPSVLQLIETHKEYLIINIANEFGKVRWTTNQTQSLNTFKVNYQNLIGDLRQAGVDVPIMIDAPDCGQSSSELLSISSNLLSSDSQANLIFSAHTYWYGYAGTTQAIDTKISEILNSNVCFVFGEVSNRQDVTGNQVDGVYNLDAIYQHVLLRSCQNSIGVLIWAFNHDWHVDREMSPTSNVSNLTPFGNDILYNSVYGFINGNCQSRLSNDVNALGFSYYPNPTSGYVFFDKTDSFISIDIFDNLGRHLKKISSDFEFIDMTNFSEGMYLFTIRTTNGVTNAKIVLKK